MQNKTLFQRLLNWKRYLLAPQQDNTNKKQEAYEILQSKVFPPEFYSAIGLLSRKGAFAKEFNDLLYFVSIKGRIAGKHEDYTKFGEDLMFLITDMADVSGVFDKDTNLSMMEMPENFTEIK